jgi:hypothetical protein
MLMPHWRGGLVLSQSGTRIQLMGPESSDNAAVLQQTATEQNYGQEQPLDDLGAGRKRQNDFNNALGTWHTSKLEDAFDE